MGKHFGNLQRLSGVTYYSLSPNELKPLKGMLNPGFMNTIRRFRENVFYIAPLLEKNGCGTFGLVLIYFLFQFFLNQWWKIPTLKEWAFITAYIVYDWAKKENYRLKRKNPDDYKDEK